MITVLFNKPDFEYDVHSLIKAFFPKETVEMYYTCAPEDVANQNVACTHHERGEESGSGIEQADHVFEICYGEANVQIGWEMLSPRKEKWNVEFFADYSDRSAVKNSIKQHLYHLLEKGTGRRLPWGTLTGIRPTKIPMKLLEEGHGDAEIASYMKETYLASDEKARLAIEIAKREKELLGTIDYENGYSLYIGIPFCPSTCLYCSFTSYPLTAWEHRVDAYLDALEKELTFVAEHFQNRKLNTVYFGGGTPTTLDARQLDRIIHKVKSSFDFQNCLEFTVEAGRPDSITEEKLEALKKNGIDRISVNPQTMKQQTLDIIGRRHTVEQTIESFHLARKLGFGNINTDLIIGLPEEGIDDVRATMEALKELGPDSITIHSLAVKRAARLNMFKDYYKDMQMVNTQEHMDLCEQYCRGMGLEPYYLYRQKGMAGNMENVGYAKPGKAGIYNILIMEEVQSIVALGAGSITKRVYPDGTIKRCDNVKDVAQYIGRIDEMIERKRKLFL